MNNRGSNTAAEGDLNRQINNSLTDLERDTAREDLCRLAQSRNRALGQSAKSRKYVLWPALGASLASVALIALLINPASQTEPVMNISLTENQLNESQFSESLVDESLLELFDDLDFYDWLAQADT
tara:strand:- start:5880 stop:6257 length:378 start_codon:yes stop_codon:yes gene_type:complete